MWQTWVSVWVDWSRIKVLIIPCWIICCEKKMQSKYYLYIMTTPVSLYNIYHGQKTSNTPHIEASTCTNLLRADLSNGTQLIINIINVNKPTVFCPSLDSCLQVLKTFILLNPIIYTAVRLSSFHLRSAKPPYHYVTTRRERLNTTGKPPRNFRLRARDRLQAWVKRERDKQQHSTKDNGEIIITLYCKTPFVLVSGTKNGRESGETIFRWFVF